MLNTQHLCENSYLFTLFNKTFIIIIICIKLLQKLCGKSGFKDQISNERKSLFFN